MYYYGADLEKVVHLKRHFQCSNCHVCHSSRTEVTNRVVVGLITWFAGPGKSSREFLYIYIFKVYVRGHVTSTSLSRTSSTKFLRLEGFKMVHAKYW